MRNVCVYLSLATLAMAGCIERDVARSRTESWPSEQVEVPVEVNRKLDLLFVVDDSNSMRNEQTSLATHFVSLIDELVSLEHGLPDLHIGVVSTDLGVGPGNELARCDAAGAGGILQNQPRVTGCNPPADRFIIDELGEGGERVRNYQGDLADSFACIAQLGDQGCGFEQPLEAMRRALDGSIPANDGFLRDDARLAVIFITDEDDCSAHDQEVFNTDNPSLGPWQHGYRCFDHGVVCDTDTRQEGPQLNCRPAEDSPYLAGVTEYVEFLRGLKRYPERDVMVAGIVGSDADPVVVRRDPDDGYLRVAQSCFAHETDEDGAFPPVRLRAFFNAFETHRQTDICTPELADALAEIGAFIGPPPEGACLPAGLVDADAREPGLQPHCIVTEVRDPYTALEQQLVIDACDNPGDPRRSSTLPCYTMTPAPDLCTTDHGLLLEAQYAEGETVPTATIVRAQCEQQASD